jgi:hypothetical protein
MPLPARAALTALALASLAACATGQARTPVPPPALDTPAPPARMLVPAPPLEPPAAAPPVAAPAENPAPPKPNPPPSRTPDRSTPPPAQQTPPPPDPPAPVLQTQNAGELENRARNSIDVAQKNLAKLEPRSLGRDLRDQFDQAQRFVTLALQQIAIKNFVRAVTYAENAAAIAGQLVK